MNNINYLITENDEALSYSDLCQKFKELGLEKGCTLEVHAFLDSLGPIISKTEAVINSLIDTIGFEGTLATSAFNTLNQDPSINSEIRIKQANKYRDNVLPFERHNYLSSNELANCLKQRPGVSISNTISSAYVAIGKYAKLICSRQPLNFPLGQDSPCDHLYQLDAYELLIGCDYDQAISLRLALSNSKYSPVVIKAGAIKEEEKRKYLKYLDYEYDDSILNEIGAFLESKGLVKSITIGKANCRLFKLKEAIDFGTEYLKKRK